MSYSFVYGEKRSIINLEANIFSYITSKHILGNEINNIICYSENSNVEVYYNSSEMAAQSIFSEKLKDKKIALSLLEEAHKTANEFNDFLQNISKDDFSSSNNEQLLAVFEKYFSLLSNVFSYYRFSRPEITDNLKEKISSEIKASPVAKSEILSSLLLSNEITEIEKEKKAFASICSANISDCDLIEHAKNFPWLFSNTYNIENAINYLKKRTKEPIKESQTKGHEKIPVTNLSDESVFLINFLRNAGTVRLSLKCAWAGSEFSALNLFEEISKRAGLSVEDFMASYRKLDVLELLKYGTKLLDCSVEQRKKNYLYVIRDCRKSFFSGPIAKKRKEDELSLNFDSGAIVGKTANSGCVKGIVRIITNGDICSLSDAIDSFKQGEILVTTMTHPNMVLLAEKALGIITDEGGITSHAAIIARELNIPCLVGTRFASKVLNNGDLIKLNASKGFAEKLNK